MIASGLLALVAGACITALGVAAHRGWWRRWVSLYRNPRLPFYVRNGGLSGLPAGLGFMSLGAGMILLSLEGVQALVVVIGLGAAFVGFGLLGAALFVGYAPPGWAKPTWLRNLERSEGQPTVDRSTLWADRIFFWSFTSIGAVALLLGLFLLARWLLDAAMA